jgi:hypothetical protein
MRVFVHVAICLALTSLTIVSPRSAAQPVTLHEQQRISIPEPYFPFAGVRDVCLHEGDLLAIAVRAHPDPFAQGEVDALLHFKQQAGGDWQFVRELISVQVDRAEEFFGSPDLDCEGSLGAFTHPAGGATVIEFTSAGPKLTPIPGLSGASHADIFGSTVGIAGSWRSPTTVALVRKNAAGQWADVTYAVGNPGTRFNTPEITGPNNLWVAATEIAATGDEYEPDSSSFVDQDMQVFDLIGGSWRLTTTFDPCCLTGAVINDRLALKLDEWTKPGDVGSYFVRDAAGAWTVRHSLLSDEHIFVDESVFIGQRAFAQIFYSFGGIGTRSEVVVFRQEAPGQYRHEATLRPSSGFSRRFSVDGNRVATAGPGPIRVFDIPATLPVTRRLEKSFSNPSTADWSFSGKYDWSIVSSGGSRVFRQLRTDAWARAVLTTFSGTDQAIEADVRINELFATSPGVGLMLRYTDQQNYYYLLVNRNILQIGKVVNGVFQIRASTGLPLPLELGRTYRLRLEAIGSQLVAFVNGQRVVGAIDESHTGGLAGLTMFRARTDYDNVIVTTRPQTALLADDFQTGPSQRPWTSAPANAWSVVQVNVGSDGVYRQSLLSGTPRAVNGGPTRDQVVSAIVRPNAFNSGVADAFVGLMARHVDDSNHYYVALFRDRAAIRKRANGVHSSIKQVPFAFIPGTAYRVRFEAIGSSLRLYINDQLVAEGVDATLPTGRYGLITFNATADFDSFRAVRP